MTITGDYLFIGLLLFALTMMLFHLSRRDILLALVSSFTWFVIWAWLFIGDTAVLGLDENWKVVLAWMFVILVFVPWLLQMNTEIRHEAGGKRWIEYGPKPKTKIPNYEEYKAELRRRLGR